MPTLTGMVITKMYVFVIIRVVTGFLCCQPDQNRHLVFSLSIIKNSYIILPSLGKDIAISCQFSAFLFTLVFYYHGFSLVFLLDAWKFNLVHLDIDVKRTMSKRKWQKLVFDFLPFSKFQFIAELFALEILFNFLYFLETISNHNSDTAWTLNPGNR